MPITDDSQPKTYWRSLDELQQTPEFLEFLHREFPAAASEFPQGVSRRRWLQLMGASLAFGGLAGCRWEKETIAPFTVRPANRLPGVPQKYATALELGGYARPLLVTCYDGRPIKIDGNPEHPESRGASDCYSQASVLQLYDPDRVTRVREAIDGQQFTRSWDDFAAVAFKLVSAARRNGGARFRVLAEASSSPSRQRMREKLARLLPNSKWYEYEPISHDNELLGTEQAFGRRLQTHYDLANARTIVCLDADLFATHPSSVKHVRDWAARRVPENGPMNRLYVVESQFTTTGAAADHRLPLRSSQIGEFLTELEQHVERLLMGTDEVSPTNEKDEEHGRDAGTTIGRERLLAAMAEDLAAQRGAGVIIVGARQPAHVHARAHQLNAKLQNFDRTVYFTESSQPNRPTHVEAIRRLAAEMRAGKVDTLLILGGNPVYNAPADVDFPAALAKVTHRIHLSEYEDETSRACQWHLPRAHALEAWGDARSFEGRLSVIQPLIEPLHGGKSDIELLALLCAEKVNDGQSLVRETLRELLPADDFESAWRKLLHDGFLADEQPRRVVPELRAIPVSEPNHSSSEREIEIVFNPGASVYDGRFANNGWLQETPDPLTKIVWDNAAIVSPSTAKELGLKDGMLVRLTNRGRSVTLPTYILPGQAPGSVGIALGYGRTAAGHVGGSDEHGIAPVGVNVYQLRTSDAIDFDQGVAIEPTGESYELATTQDHHSIDKVGMEEISGRIGALVREGTLAEYEHHPDFAQHAVHHPPLESLWEERTSEGPAWGMSIDLTKCIGCNACMVACQSENNIPIVGREQVAYGREMHWIRVDRYFSGDPDEPAVVTQPVTCHQCENAPCEQVCPVAATMHSTEGLNDMVYNRCIGTRYCANNCPYKVRRFNFFNFNKHLEEANQEIARLVLNPEVTVRARGVMEKCTYCVQRIQNTKIAAKNENRPIRDGEIQTACQQACPAQAIVFGDLSQPENQVAKAHANSRAYAMLAELNIKPRTKYLARIRNPHPDLANHYAPAEQQPHS